MSSNVRSVSKDGLRCEDSPAKQVDAVLREQRRQRLPRVRGISHRTKQRDVQRLQRRLVASKKPRRKKSKIDLALCCCAGKRQTLRSKKIKNRSDPNSPVALAKGKRSAAKK